MQRHTPALRQLHKLRRRKRSRFCRPRRVKQVGGDGRMGGLLTYLCPLSWKIAWRACAADGGVASAAHVTRWSRRRSRRRRRASGVQVYKGGFETQRAEKSHRTTTRPGIVCAKAARPPCLTCRRRFLGNAGKRGQVQVEANKSRGEYRSFYSKKWNI